MSMNWETNEAIDWLINDSVAYDEVKIICLRTDNEYDLKVEIKDTFYSFIEDAFSINPEMKMGNIDWVILTDYILELVTDRQETQ